MSLANWPFLVMLVIVAGTVSAPSLIEGDWKVAGLVCAGIWVFPLAIGVIQLLPELFGARMLVGVYAKGVVWSRLGRRGFIPWSNLEQSGLQFTERRGREGKPITLPQSGPVGPALAFIGERLPKQ